LHQDAGLLELLGQRVAIMRVASKGACAHDQVGVQRADDAHLDAKLVGCLGFALADARHLWRMPGVELALSIHGFALAAWGHDALGFGQRLLQRLARGLAGKRSAFLGKGLLQIDVHLLGRLHQLAARHLQQTAVAGAL
jgi:hypothetical protein